jgi:hypothetical protein
LGNVVNRSLLTVSLVVFSTHAGSCKQSSLPETLPIRSIHVAAPFTKDIYSVEELLVNPQGFAHTLVTVSGCYISRFEMSALTACDGRSGALWVEDAGTIEAMKKLRLYLRHQGKLDELMSMGAFENEELLFAYNERHNSHAWNKLPRGYGIVGAPVVLLGQFETSGTAKGGFGHLGAYSNEFILVDVLGNKPPTKHSKSR